VILLAGGTGTLGPRVARRLNDRGLRVRVLSRDPDRASRVLGDLAETVQGDVRDPASVERAVAGVDTVVSAISGFGPKMAGTSRSVDRDGNANLIRAAKRASVEHVVMISVCQAAPDHPITLFRMKHEAERELLASGLSHTILRPTASMESWLGILCAPLAEKGKTVAFGRGRNPINFVSADDVAGFVELAVTDPALRGQALDLGGPENVSMNQMVETFEAITGVRGKKRHVPVPAMRAMSTILKRLKPGLAEVIEAAVVMDTRDMTCDASSTWARFPSHVPTTLTEAIRRASPGSSADRASGEELYGGSSHPRSSFR
jgi:uncharacterized protein YbjT (DUF2867 family)